MKKRKKHMALIGCFIMILFFLFVSHVFAANMESEGSGMSTTTTNTYNVMLLVDKSGSMNGTDKPRLALSAACQFVDQLCTAYDDLATTTNVGVMAFSEVTEFKAELTSLDSSANTDYLKLRINDITYKASGTGGTDLGTALYDAVQLLKKQASESDKNMIVMFTDGYSVNVLDRQAAEQNLDHAFDIAEELGCEIYIVGLNSNSKIKPEGRREIYQIADTVQLGNGIVPADEEDPYTDQDNVNYLITDKIKDVREFYGRIFARMIGSELIFLEEHQFSVLSDSVVEADVTVYSDTEISSVSVVDPEGNVQKENGKDFIVLGDDFYRIIKIMNPKRGTWTVNVISNDDGYKTYVIQFFGFELAINATWMTQEEFGDAEADGNGEYIGKVTIIPMYEKEYENDLLAGSAAEYVVENEDGSSAGTYTLAYEEESGNFVGYFKVGQGRYNIKAFLENDGLNRMVECSLTVNPDKGNDGDNEDEKYGERDEKDDINREDYEEEGISWIFAAAAAVLSIIIIVWMILRKKESVSGEFDVQIKSGRYEEMEYTITNYPKGRKISLWKLMDCIIRNKRAEDDISEEEKDLCDKLEKRKGEIAKRKLLICEVQTSRQKKKVYKLLNVQGNLLNLSGMTKCYEALDPELVISVKFSPWTLESDGLAEDGALSSNSHADKKKRGRYSSRRKKI